MPAIFTMINARCHVLDVGVANVYRGFLDRTIAGQQIRQAAAMSVTVVWSVVPLCLLPLFDSSASCWLRKEGYSGFVVGKADRSKNDGPSRHSFSRNCPRAVLAVKAPLRRAKRGLDCSGPL